MTQTKNLFSLFLLAMAGIFISSCTDSYDLVEEVNIPEESVEDGINLEFAEELSLEGIDIDVPIEKGRRSRYQSSYFTFNTLNKALRCTGLDAALFSGEKAVYAPSDFAFAKLGLNEKNICKKLDAETLTSILLYHVVDRPVDRKERGCVTMINGDVLKMSTREYRLFANDSRVYAAYRQTNHAKSYMLNVFVVNTVLTVPDNTIVETAVGAEDFSSLVAAVLAADPAILEALSDETKVYTVFAPTNAAFGDLLALLGVGTLEEAVAAVGVDALSTILLYHVVEACAFSNDLSDGQVLTTLQGETVAVDLQNLSINDPSGVPAGLVVEGLDILTSNGIVHTIDKVLVPEAILQVL